MHFYIKDNEINNNIIVQNEDDSFCYENLNDTWDYQVELDSSGQIILNFDSSTGKCTSVEGYLTIAKAKSKKEMTIPTSIRGGLFIKNFDPSILEEEYLHIKKTVFYDAKKAIVAIGDIETNCKFYEFGDGQYVAFDNKQNICCVIVKFKNK